MKRHGGLTSPLPARTAWLVGEVRRIHGARRLISRSSSIEFEPEWAAFSLRFGGRWIERDCEQFSRTNDLVGLPSCVFGFDIFGGESKQLVGERERAQPIGLRQRCCSTAHSARRLLTTVSSGTTARISLPKDAAAAQSWLSIALLNCSR